MDWNAETNRDRLKRIIALLFALADLADRTSTLPRPVVCLVLWFLRPAEAIAREFVSGRAQHPGATLPETYGSEDAPHNDAARLALRFRALALALGWMLAQPFAQFWKRSVRPTALNTRLLKPANSLGQFVLAHPAPDTS